MARYTIIGVGPVGALMALMLARRGHRVRAFEQRPDPRATEVGGGRSINLALTARGILALEGAGLMPRIASQMIAMPGRMLHDERGELQFLPYGKNESEIIHAISRERLNRVLIEAAAEQPLIEMVFQHRCVDVDPDAGRVTLHDEARGGSSVEPFEILLGTDGAGSAVRGALLERGLSTTRLEPLAHDYKELLIPARTHGGFEDHYAFEPHALHIWPRGGYMLIALPNIGGTFTATLFLPRHGNPGFDHLTDGPAVQSFFDAQFPDAAAALPDLTEQYALHPQSQLGTLHCQRWHVGGRVLLLGDSAHAMVPFHGQGLNCGFEDCQLLERLLSAGTDAAAVFAQFERARRPNADAIASMALENYLEMRATVRDPQFVQRRALAAELERRYPGRFIPRYSMVTFHPEIPYAEAQRRGAQQARILDALAADFGPGLPDDATLREAERLLDVAGL